MVGKDLVPQLGAHHGFAHQHSFASVLGMLCAAPMGEDDAGQVVNVVKLQQKGLLGIKFPTMRCCAGCWMHTPIE